MSEGELSGAPDTLDGAPVSGVFAVRSARLTAQLQGLGLTPGVAARVAEQLVLDGWVYFGPRPRQPWAVRR
jgi:hypothetical protein